MTSKPDYRDRWKLTTMTADENQQSWRTATVMPRTEVIGECREAQHEHETSDACARTIVRLHGDSRNFAMVALSCTVC